MRLPKHKTKIVCTIGPASRSEDALAAMLRRGMNVARPNFAHGSSEEHRESIRRIRAAAARTGRLCAILADLPGPKIRVGDLPHEPLLLHKGDMLILTPEEAASPTSGGVRIPVSCTHLPDSVSPGSAIFLSDGFIQLRVQEVVGRDVHCQVIMGGPLLSHKGLNPPGAHMLVEAAIGKFPVETVDMMARVAASIERQRRLTRPADNLREALRDAVRHQQISIEDVIALSVADAAEALQVRCVLTPTRSGSTPRLISRFRPACWVLAFTDVPQTCQALAFSAGVLPFLPQPEEGQWRGVILRRLRELCLARPGERVVLTEGIAPGMAGGTNLMRISTLE